MAKRGPINQTGVSNDLELLNNYNTALNKLRQTVTSGQRAMGELGQQVKNFNNEGKDFSKTARAISKILNPGINDKTIGIIKDYRAILDTMKPTIESNADAMMHYTLQLKLFKDELKEIVKLNNNGKLNLGFNYRVTQKGGNPSKVLPNGDTVEGSPRTHNKGKSQEDIIEGHFRDLTKQILNGNEIIQKESTRKWNNIASSVFGTIASNSNNRYISSAASIFKKSSDINLNKERKKRYEELAAEGLRVSQTATSEKVKAAAADTSAAASTAAKGSGALATAGTIGLAVVAISALAAACAAVEIASKKATERNVRLAQSMKIMGESISGVSERALNTRKKEIELANMWENTLNSIQDVFGGVHEAVINLLTDILSLTGASKKESLEKQYTSQADISARAQQSGFNVGSANVLARGTYDLANQHYKTFGENPSKMAKDLSDAWLSGSDAAKKYGVVVDDLTLSGYMASKGIDIVNVEISDAMRQYYRFQLMQEELNRTSDEGMSQNIKQWKQYGMIIDQTKNKLFSFDEVIQLNAFDPNIPDLGNAELEDPIEPTINPIIGKPKNDPEPIDVKVSPIVNPPVADVIAEINAIPSSVDVDVNTNVNGAAAVANLQSNLEAVTVPWSTTLTLICPALAVAQSILGLLENITGKSWQSELGLNVQGQELVDNAYASLQAVAGTYVANTVFKVTGLDQLREALHLAKELEQYKVSSSSYNEKYAQTSMNKSAMQAGTASKLLNRSKEDILNQALHPISSSLANKSYKSATSSYNNIKSLGANVNANVGGFSEYNGTLNAINAYKNNNSNTNQKLETYKGAYLYGTTLDKNLKALAVGVGLATGGAAAVGGLTGIAGAGAGLSSTSAGTSADIISRSELLEHYFAKNKLTAELIADSFGAKASGFASGGIGTKESLIHAFEGDNAEAVIPLESQQGIDYLGNAMKQALGDDGAGGSNITVNVNLSGLNLADNDAQWDRVGRKISEVIAIQNQRRGNLNYGSK